MRLHRLEVAAFGPFCGTESIDFDTLSDAGLFLIHGQTGAGKTSVLDAVCFALFGRVPGVRDKAGGLRSDHADPATATQVTLEVTLRGRRFRFTRSPAWDRKKLRGTGTTQEKARVRLEEFTGGAWHALSTRIDETADQVEALLGMNVDQFCQVALLPQGAFAAFLRSGADDRRKVLERLFATDVYARVEQWLTDARVTAGREVAGLRGAAESAADRITEVTGARRPGDTADGSLADEALESVEVLPAWAAELAGQFSAVRTVAQTLAAEYEAELTDRRRLVEEGRAVADRRQRHADAERRRAVLAERSAERDDLTARLDAAARADRVLPSLEAVAERERQHRRHRERAAESRARVGYLVPGAAPDDVLAKAERHRRDEMAALAGLLDEADRERRLTAEAAELARTVDRLTVREAEQAELLTKLPARVDEQRGALQELRMRIAGRPAVQAAVAAAADRVDKASRRDVVLAGLAEAETDWQTAVDRAQRLRDRFQELRQARLDGMAAILAAELTDGDPCAVCGSVRHPAPAPAQAGTPTVQEEKSAESAYERAQTEREERAARVAELRAERDGLLEVTQEPLDVLTAEWADVQRELHALDEAAAESELVQRRLSEAERALTRARDERDTALNSLTEARTSHHEISTEAERLRGRLDEARGDDATLRARIDRLTAEADALAAAAQATGAAATAADALAQARATAERAAERAGFSGTEAAGRHVLPEPEQQSLRRRIRDFDTEEATVRALLDDPELVAAAARPAPDLAALQAGFTAAQQAHNAAHSMRQKARDRCDRLAELREELDAAVREWRPVADRYAVVARLAGLTSGQHADNHVKMRLSAYVLAARLEQVVAAANERLTRMSGGRYVLEHTTDKAAGDGRRGATGGLGLRVIDAWTGGRRDPATLSGGESFITSLALALGLADVVTAEAGGTEIGTLFVDEGFGTLDEETLDEVMDVLDALRDGGRAVGVVSHVAELRTRVPVQLRVHKQRTGSTVAVTAG